ncbi:hypothetical protein [Frankia sp. R82]|uniref:hypothetical protein n=1 Tax=Frankia sp. R82 TaxID=2950553 RepID=UPI002043C877|nr:hypothetical protein [Frankia sp. R82]MCM3882498.1 hypothetical protein [Frankia sp. R82]
MAIELAAGTLTLKIAEYVNKGRPKSFSIVNRSEKNAYFAICYPESDLSIGWGFVRAGDQFAWEHAVPLIGYAFRIYARTSKGSRQWHNSDRTFAVGMPAGSIIKGETFRIRRCFDAVPHLIERNGISRFTAVPSRQFYLTGDMTYTIR